VVMKTSLVHECVPPATVYTRWFDATVELIAGMVENLLVIGLSKSRETIMILLANQ
jgi:hypothetical protein